MPGMHGPSATKEQLDKVLIPKEDGGILTRKGVVDFTIGKGVAPGVFVVAESAMPASSSAWTISISARVRITPSSAPII